MMKKVVLLSLLVSSVAFAGDPPKGGAATAPAPGPADAKKMMAPPPEAPKPPQELTDMAKAMSGTWKCVGKAEMGGVTGDVKGTITHKSDLDGYWITSSLSASAGKATFHGMFMTTFDAGSKRFYRQSANGHGGHGVAWGTPSGTKVSWEGEDFFGGNNHKIRGSDEMVSPKEAHIVGEYSDDGGKTWKPDHDVTCKK